MHVSLARAWLTLEFYYTTSRTMGGSETLGAEFSRRHYACLVMSATGHAGQGVRSVTPGAVCGWML